MEAAGRHQDSTLGDLKDGILAAVEKFTEGASQFDDITLLVVRYRGPAAGVGQSAGLPAAGS
jgi:serine phosphatase RsbU (regulator of sigma subunit)